ncbi:MAG TPA: ribose 5-phosphate isomerase B [Salinivirgaceae bacterium]|nr:ribose 5-phosphate isomerase B [Salinivirgaceae bacterium]
MKIFIAADHAGYPIKYHLVNYLSKKGYMVYDLGTQSEESVDYPDYGHALAQKIDDQSIGIALCGSGIGISITLNRHRNIRAALCWNPTIAELSRLHNDANVCVLPGRFVTVLQAEAIVEAFISGSFEGGRHQKRIEKINPEMP